MCRAGFGSYQPTHSLMQTCMGLLSVSLVIFFFPWLAVKKTAPQTFVVRVYSSVSHINFRLAERTHGTRAIIRLIKYCAQPRTSHPSKARSSVHAFFKWCHHGVISPYANGRPSKSSSSGVGTNPSLCGSSFCCPLLSQNSCSSTTTSVVYTVRPSLSL